MALVLISIAVRFINISDPLTGFRQTQTAITVSTYIDEGVSVFKYQTPVLGAPWTLPFEFPSYQLSAYALYKVSALFLNTDLNVILRLANFLYFYGCAFFLFRITKRFFNNAGIAKAAVLIFVLFPFGVYWSSTGMIEFAAVFFALGYVYFFTLFLDKPDKENYKIFFAALFFGVFGYLTKITTMFPYCLFLGFIIVNRFTKKRFSIPGYLQILALILIPLFIGIAWTKWTDYVKIIAGFEALASKNLQQWNFGTLSQKFSFENYRHIYENARKMGINPAMFAALLIFIPVFLKRKKEFLYALIPVFCSVATVMVFFNLYYIHDYYWCSFLPFFTMFGGYFIYNVISYIQSFFSAQAARQAVTIFCSVALLFVFWYKDPYVKRAFRNAQYFKEYKGGLLSLTDYVKTHTGKNDLIMVFDNDWNSEIPYNAQRKALMVCWINENSYSGVADDYELFITNKDSQSDSVILSKLANIGFETSIGGYNVYRRKK